MDISDQEQPPPAAEKPPTYVDASTGSNLAAGSNPVGLAPVPAPASASRVKTNDVLGRKVRPHVAAVHVAAAIVRETTAWDQARENVESAQIRYKKQYDKSAQEITILAGERVMVKREAGKKGKLSCRYDGPYRVVEVRGNTVEVRPVEQPDTPAEIDNISRICQCPSEVPEGVFKSQRRGFRRVKARGRARKSAGGVVTT